MTTEITKTGSYKNFNATLEDGRYLSVQHCNHENDPGAGSNEVTQVLSHFMWVWGLAADNGTERHSGGAASATVHVMTASEIRKKLQFYGSKGSSQLMNAAREWAENLEEQPPDDVDADGGSIVLYYEIENGNKRERHLTDDELVALWSWAVATEQFS